MRAAALPDTHTADPPTHAPAHPIVATPRRPLVPPPGPDDVLITHGAIGANELLYKALVGPGDDVIAIVPNYQQVGRRCHRVEP